MENTPIQKAIAHCEQEIKDHKDGGGMSLHEAIQGEISYGVMKNYLQSLLIGERQFAENAFDAGYDFRSSLERSVIDEFGNNSKPDFTEFYKQYNQ